MSEPAGSADARDQISKLPSVDKALCVLLALGDAGFEGLELKALSDALGIKKSSLHASISALRFRGFVAQSAQTRRYYLGPAISEISQTFMRNYDLRSQLRFDLMRFSREINEVCYMSLLDGAELLYLERTESDRPIQPAILRGTRLPAVNTAMGRAMIAATYGDFQSFKSVFGPGYRPLTRHAPPSIEAAWEEIKASRRRGFGLDREENVEGLTAVAVGIVQGASAVASVSVVSLAGTGETDGPIRHLGRLRQTVAAVLQPPMQLYQPNDQSGK